MAEKIQGWALVVIVALIVAAAFQMHWFGLGTNGVEAGGTTVVTAGVTYSPVLTDKANVGTTVGGTKYISVNDAPYQTGLTSFNAKDNLKVLIVNGTTYHNAVTSSIIPAGVTSIYPSVTFNKNATVTMTVYDQFTLLDAAGAAANATIASGETKNLDVYLQGTSDQSTQDMVCVVETSDNTKVEEITLSGATKTSRGKPSSYTLMGTSSAVWVYDMAPITDSAKVQHTLTIKSKSGQDASGTQYKIACMTKENFLDSKTGAISYDIEDSQGVAKSMATYSFSDYLN